MALQTKYKEQLIEIIHKYLPNAIIYLFGSRAIDKEKAGSDIDIALDIGQEIPRNLILKILNDIDDTSIPMKIDLIDMHVVQENLKKDILREGIKWTN